MLRRVFATICCLSLVGYSSSAHAGGTLVNAGFESGISGWSVAGWLNVATPSIDRKTTHAGSAALLMTGGSEKEGYVYEDIDVLPQAKTATLSGWAKTSGIPANWESGIYAEFIDPGGKWLSIGTAGTIAGADGDSNWKLLSGSIAIPAGAKTLRFEVRVRCNNPAHTPLNLGSAWFDDLDLKQVDAQGSVLSPDGGNASNNLHFGRNVLVNGDFNAGLQQWANADWLPVVAPQIDSSSGRTPGASALRFDGQVGREANVYQPFLVSGGGKYYVSGWVKTKALPSGWYTGLVIEFTANDKWLATAGIQNIAVAGDWDWTHIEGVVDVPAGATSMRVEPVVRPCSGKLDDQAFGSVWFSDLSAQPAIDTTKPAAVSIYRFAPAGIAGIFFVSQRPSLTLSLDSSFSKSEDLTIHLDVADFRGASIYQGEKHVRMPACGSQNVPIALPAVSKTGFYSVHALIFDGNTKLASGTSSFCVTTPMKSPNPFFGFTQYEGADVAINRALGAGVYPIWFGWHSIERTRGTFDFSGTDASFASAADGGFRFIGAIDPTYTGPDYVTPAWIKEIVDKWRQSHPDYKTNPADAYPPEYFDCWREYVSAIINHFKGRIKIWQFIREIDWQQGEPGGIDFYAKTIKVGSVAIKQVDPAAIVGGIAVGVGDGLAGFPVARKVWNAAGDSLDGLFVHPYVQPCIYAPGQTPVGDEKGGLRRMLLAAQDFVNEHGRRLVAIDENGVKVSRTLPVDCPTNKAAADALAHSFVIARSVPLVGWYSCFLRRAEDFGGDAQDPPGAYDYGYWLHDNPRPAAAVLATCARMLDAAFFSSEVPIHSSVYAYCFGRANGSLAALWTGVSETVPLRARLPKASRILDVMGNDVPVSMANGVASLPLSTSLLFVESPCAPSALASCLSAASCPLPKLSATACLGSRRTIDVYVRNQSPAVQKVSVRASLRGGARLASIASNALVPASGLTKVSLSVAGDLSRIDGSEFTSEIVGADASIIRIDKKITAWPVHRMPAGVQVDGDLAKYRDMPPIVLDSANSVNCSAGPNAARKLWAGPADLSMKVWLAWDDANLYFAAKVVRDHFIQDQTGSRIFAQDGFQLAFDTLSDAIPPEFGGRRGFDDDDYQYGLALTKNGPESYCWIASKTNADMAGKPAVFKPVIVRASDTVVDYEVAIPWSALAPLRPEAGAGFGFDLNYTAANAPGDWQKYWMQLTPGLSEGKDPSLYRRFILVDK